MDIQRPKPHVPLPEHAKLAFKGEIFDVYQWEQEMFDGTKATFERLKRDDTTSVMPILPDGKILLIRQQQPGTQEYYSCPGGRMDEGEDALSSAKRELKEETGYEADEWILWDSFQPVHKIDWAQYIFIAKGLRKVSEPHLDSGEKIEVLSVTLDEMLEIAAETEIVGNDALRELYEARVNPEKKDALQKLFAL
jgi:ADP-ribose pyrophosphatase